MASQEPKFGNWEGNEVELKDQKASKEKMQHSTLEEGEIWRSTGSPNVTGGKNSSNSPQHRAGDTPRKAPSEGNQGSALLTPARSRLRSVTRGDDSPDQSPAVPKFGGWDETDPSTTEDYSQIFSRVREEKHTETGKVPVMPTEASHSNGPKPSGHDTPTGCSCFPWGKR